jgi:pyrrolidone-carboxylate peptidase
MSDKGTFLLTGHDAFGDFKMNPSIAACLELDRSDIGEYNVAVEIPLKFNGVSEAIEMHLERYKPHAPLRQQSKRWYPN